MTKSSDTSEVGPGDGPAKPNPELSTDPAHARANPEAAKADPHTPYPDMPKARPETGIRVGVPVLPQPVDTAEAEPNAQAPTEPT